jgi:glycogen operon protein
MIAFRRTHPVLSEERFYTDSQIEWLGRAGGSPNWFDPKEKALACAIRDSGRVSLLLMFNAGTDPADFYFPALSQGFRWHMAVDTSRAAPKDLFTAGEEPAVDHSKPWSVKARSSAIFVTLQLSDMTRKTEHNAGS